MVENVRRRLFGRIVLWDPAGGTIIDLPSRHVLSFGGPSETEEYSTLASGDKTPVRRRHRVQIPITERESARVIEILQIIDCPLKCVFLGIEGTDNFIWLEPTKVNVTDPEVNPGQLAQKVVELDTSIFYPAIWEGMDILEGVPWRGTSQQTRNGNDVLRNKGSVRDGYEGPLWKAPQDSSVNLAGESSGIDSSNEAVIKIEFPVWSCKLSLETEDSDFDALVSARDWNDNFLDASGNELVLPDKTYYVKVRIQEPVNLPVLLNIKSVGEPYGLLEGNVSEDCSRVSDPFWTETGLTLTGENV